MMNVIKRDGSREPLNITKITDSYEWAKEGLNINLADMENAVKLHFYNDILTKDIHDAGIKTCKDLTSIRYPDYDRMGARLLMQKAYKESHRSKDMPDLKEYITKMVELGHYDKLLLEYSDEEFILLNEALVKDRDFNFSLSGLEQLYDKYSIMGSDDDGEKVYIETPQLMFMAVAMGAFFDYKKEDKLSLTKYMYELLSTFKISLPSPMMRALRTNSRDYASCITIKIGDNLYSWAEAFKAVLFHTAASAGIGVDISDIASLGDLVKNGTIEHGGKVPVMKVVDDLVQAAQQNGRRGQAVAYTNFFDPEIETIFGLKSPRTEVTKRINDLKHCVKLNQLVYDRAKSGKPITLFSPRKAPKVYELFNSKDYDGFVKAYEEAEAQDLGSGYIDAREFFMLDAVERFEVGIYYVMNIDEANANTPYLENIAQSNICLEFISPTKNLDPDKPNSPDIGVCILSNINQAEVDNDELPKVLKLLVYMLNHIKGRQIHPMPQANAFVEQYGSLGIGFANHALWTAKQGLKYGSSEVLEKHDAWMEKFQYNLIKASAEYAEEFDACISKFDQTGYSLGIMPLDRYKKTVDELVEPKSREDWDGLKEYVIRVGMANAALSMIPPSETSSVIGGMDSSMDPIKKLLTVKSTKTLTFKQLAAGIPEFIMDYDLAYERAITSDYIKHVAITQKWIDQGISANTFYNPELYKDNLVPIKDIISDIFLAKKYGVKTLYYNNVMVSDDDGQAVVQDACGSGGCSV